MSYYPQNTAELKEFLCKHNLPYKISELGNTGLCRINTFAPAESFYLDRDLQIVQAKYYTDFGQFNLWWLERIEAMRVSSTSETHRKIAVMQACTEGKEIEMRFLTSKQWQKADTPNWNWEILDYRIKQEPLQAANTRINELEKALKLCLHVIEKGIEVRMQEKWPILKEPLEEAKTAANAVLWK